MKLADYMKVARLTDAAVAAAVKRDRSTVSRWRKGATRPDWDALGALEDFTQGAVTARDFVEQREVAA